MKNLLTYLIFTTIIFSVNLSGLNGQTKDWTLLIYVVGSDIVEDAITDIGEMKAAGNTDNINIVGLLGGAQLSGWEKPSASIFVDGQEIPQSFVPSDTVMISIDNITEFIDWGVTNYPAEKYMLMFYNHGMDIRGFGWDNTIDDQFKINDIQAGIANSDFISQGNKFEVLGFDACLMACLEAQSALQNVAKYYVASEETEPYHAWNWTPIITAMNTQSGLDGVGLGRLIVDTYIQHSRDEGTEHVTLSLVELAKIDALETAMENLLASLDDDIYLSNFIQARAKSEEYHKVISNPEQSDDMVDIGDLVKHLKKLEPTLETLADDVLAKLKDAVIYERSDATRPQANGISMYVPMNVFVDDFETNAIIQQDYLPIDFSLDIKDFISNDYLNYALGDNEPTSGSIDNSLGFTGGGSSVLGGKYSAIRIDDTKDLHQVQVILMEEITGIPNDFIVLGSSFADTVVHRPGGSTIYGYEWDEEWLSLNGHPAYVADIQEFEVEDSMGNFDYRFTRLHIPAILNPGTQNQKDIMISYAHNKKAEFELEGILREPYGDEVLSPSKERIDLKAGDQVQLIYEVFDANTNETSFVPDMNAIIDIQTGNEDLVLGHSMLAPGKYHVGFVIMDHAHNDTVIYDPMVREITSTSTEILSSEAFQVAVFPNPTSNFVQLRFMEPVDANISLYSISGQEILKRRLQNDSETSLNLTELPNGTYVLQININDEILKKELIKQ